MFITHRPNKNSQRLLTTKCFSDHITRREATQQNCFVKSRRESDHIAWPDSTQPNSFVELRWVGLWSSLYSHWTPVLMRMIYSTTCKRPDFYWRTAYRLRRFQHRNFVYWLYASTRASALIIKRQCNFTNFHCVLTFEFDPYLLTFNNRYRPIIGIGRLSADTDCSTAEIGRYRLSAKRPIIGRYRLSADYRCTSNINISKFHFANIYKCL